MIEEGLSILQSWWQSPPRNKFITGVFILNFWGGLFLLGETDYSLFGVLCLINAIAICTASTQEAHERAMQKKLEEEEMHKKRRDEYIKQSTSKTPLPAPLE